MNGNTTVELSQLDSRGSLIDASKDLLQSEACDSLKVGRKFLSKLAVPSMNKFHDSLKDYIRSREDSATKHTQFV